MVKRLSKRTQRRIWLNLAKQSLSLYDQDIQDTKRWQTCPKPSTMSIWNKCIAIRRIYSKVITLSRMRLLVWAVKHWMIQVDGSSRDKDTSDQFSTCLSDPEENSSLSTEIEQPGEPVVVNSHDHSLVSDPISTPIGESSPSLFPGASVVAHQFHVVMASTALRHNLTYSCQTDILKLIATILPSPNHVTSASRSLTRKFIQYEQQSVVHRCCGTCMRLLPEGRGVGTGPAGPAAAGPIFRQKGQVYSTERR